MAQSPRRGQHDSAEQAVASIVAEHMLLEIDDLSWAKPLVDEARESLAHGEGMTLEEYRAQTTERFGKPER